MTIITATATESRVSQSIEIGVNEKGLPVTGISIDPAMTMKQMSEVYLGADIETVPPEDDYPEIVPNTAVLWFSSDPSVVTIYPADTPLAFAGSPGQATLTAKTVDGGFTATCLVTVEPKFPPKEGAVYLGVGDVLYEAVPIQDGAALELIGIYGLGAFLMERVFPIPDSIDGVPITGICANATITDIPNGTSFYLPAELKTVGERALFGHGATPTGNAIETIGAYAFADGIYGSTTATLTLPTSVKAVGKGAFQGSRGLEVVTIGTGLSTLPEDMFRGSSELKAAIVPDSVVSIGANAFAGCPQLTLYCNRNSAAHQYAAKNKIPFVLWNDIALRYKSTTQLFAPVPDDAADKVRWSSANGSVASVDADSGKVTAVGTGTAVITAKTQGDQEYHFTVKAEYAWWQWLIRIFLFGWLWY